MFLSNIHLAADWGTKKCENKYKIYSYFHKKTQREFWETFFQRNISDSQKPTKAKILTFSYR
jgi:hypothetical protein